MSKAETRNRSDAPCLENEDWAKGEIPCNSRSSMGIFWLFCILWNALSLRCQSMKRTRADRKLTRRGSSALALPLTCQRTISFSHPRPG